MKIDMLTGPIFDEAVKAKVQISRPHVRPRGKVELHAYLTEEALEIESSLLSLQIAGVGSDGQTGRAAVHIPQPFTFLLMKLHAFGDRMGDADSDLGRHHAMDVYRLVAMLTEADYAIVRQLVLKHTASKPILHVRKIVSTHFSSSTAIGVIRMKEHPLFTSRMNNDRMIEALADLFQ